MRKGRGVFLVLLLTLLLLTTLYPLCWMFRMSVIDPGPEGGFTLRNYKDIWTKGHFGRFALNSLVVTSTICFFNLLFSLMVGYAFARGKFPLKRPVFLGVIGSLMIPKQVLMVPIFILMVRLRLIDTYLALTLPFLVDAFNIFLMRQFILTIPYELEEVARIDGAGDFRVLFGIVMPLSLPALSVCGINSFLTSWNSFLYPLILTSSLEMRTLPVGLSLYSQGPHSVDWARLSCGGTLASLPVIIVLILFSRFIIEGLTSGSLKR